MKTLHSLILLLAFIYLCTSHSCSHDQFAKNVGNTHHIFADLSDSRLLQTSENGKIRIFVDYSQVSIGSKSQINTVKRAVNITASYYYNVLNVTRLSRLYFPKPLDSTSTALKCGKLNVPNVYLTNGTIGDLGIVCSNENIPEQIYIAQSTSCAYLETNKRPIWGMIAWNNPYLRYDQEGFQEIVSIGIHEMTHILGFSAELFETYPRGNPLKSTTDGQHYLWSPKIEKCIQKHYNCSISNDPKVKGLLLEDQDGKLIASHWEKKIMGNEIMIAGNSKNAYMSDFTLALLDSTGWYNSVDFSYAEPMLWGKNATCSFFNVDTCDSKKFEFCNTNQFSCDFDGTAIARCSVDQFTGGCKVPKYYTNTICIDENYELKNLNAKLNALERGGSNSKCFQSDYRQESLLATALNYRCYISICSFSGNYLYILLGSTITVCRYPGQVIPAQTGFEGTLKCPKSFENYCGTKKVCSYHCNKNGVCVNGQCQCTGSKEFTQTCMDVQSFQAPIGETGGFLNSKKEKSKELNISDLFPNPEVPEQSQRPDKQRALLYAYSLDFKCMAGSVFDSFFGLCLKCSEVFGCQNCLESGCISCDDGRKPNANGRC